MVVAPLHHQDVVAPLLQHVADVVLQVALVFDQNLLTGNVRAAHAHQEHVLPWRGGGEDNRYSEQVHITVLFLHPSITDLTGAGWFD